MKPKKINDYSKKLVQNYGKAWLEKKLKISLPVIFFNLPEDARAEFLVHFYSEELEKHIKDSKVNL